MATEEVKRKKKEYVPKPVQIVRTAADQQRIKLQKLMEHPERPVIIPEPPKERALPPPPDFNRNVMGSSAGAGSGEFHVYRHLRRREYARQKLIVENADKEDKDWEYHERLEENRLKAEQKTAQNRKKRIRKKLRAKLKKFKKAAGPNQNKVQSEGGEDKAGNKSESSNEGSDAEEEEHEQKRTKKDDNVSSE